MKAILEFDLNDPFEKEDFYGATKARDFWLVLFKYREWLLKEILTLPEGHADLGVYELCRGKLEDFLSYCNVNLEEYS